MKAFSGQTELTNAGFVHCETCHCNGVLQHKFKRREDKKTVRGYPVQISVFPDLNRYKKFKFGSLVGQGLLNNIKIHLNE